MMKYLVTLFLVFALALAARAQAPNQVILSFSHRAGEDSLVLNETVFTIWNGKAVSLSRADFYISEVEVYHLTPPIHNTPLTDR